MRARLALAVVVAGVALVFALSRNGERASPTLPDLIEAPPSTGGTAPELRTALTPAAQGSEREALAIAAAPGETSDETSLRAVLVRVLDEVTRAPVAGVPVALGYRFEGEPVDVWQTATAPDGTARFALGTLDIQEDADVDLGVRLAVAGSGGTFAPFDYADPPSKPIELLLVPCAPVELLVVDPQGAPFPIEGQVQLEALVPGLTRTRQDEAYVEAAIESSRARFDFVACAAELRASVIGTRPALSRSAEYRSARARGETCTIQIVVDAGGEVVGRVLDEQGAPAGNASFGLTLRAEKTLVHAGPLTTDGEGRFRVALEPQVEPGTRVQVILLSGDLGVWTRRADVPGEVVLGAGTVDLGDLRLHPVAGRITGRCVDLEGEPLAGVQVYAVSAPPANKFMAETDRKGRFAVRGSSERVALRAESAEYVMVAPVELGPGHHDDVVIEMARGGGIVASLAEGSRLDDLSLIVWDEAVLASAAMPVEDGGIGYSRWAAFDEQHRARAGGLASGSYRARVYRQGLLLQEVPDVAVALGVDTLDPRLADLALDQRLRTIAFDVVAPGGRPVEYPLVSIVRGTEHIADVAGNPEGFAEIKAMVEPGVEALITARGFRPARVVDLATGEDRRRVRLQPGIPVLLRSETRPALERRGEHAGLAFALVEQGLGAGWVSVGVPDAFALEGEARVVFPGPGRYRLGVQWTSLMRDGTSAVSPPGYGAENATEILVREEDAEGVMQIDLPDPLPR